jgi:hypothetical protein
MITKLKKLILTGGYMSKAPDRGSSFCREIVKNTEQPIRILECIFGLSEDLWDSALRKDIDLFHNEIPDFAVDFVLARENLFVKQIEEADVVYFRGGETQRMHDTLLKIQDWQDALSDKIVIGASAGAYVISSFYVHPGQLPELRNGFGLAKVKTVAHYRSTFFHHGDVNKSCVYWDTIDKIMKEKYPDIPSMKLREGEFIIL